MFLLQIYSKIHSAAVIQKWMILITGINITKKKNRKRKKRKKTDFALTDGNTAKHQTIINTMEKKQTKVLYIKKNKYKENTNKQTKISSSPSQHAFHNVLLSHW